MHDVQVAPASLERLGALLPPRRAALLRDTARRAHAAFGDRVVWHVNATASGGGVAEMLQTLLAYATGAGIDNRWLVLDAEPAFFALTKRLHNMLHGEPGDAGPLSDAEHRLYRDQLATNAAELAARISPRDIVLLHDPQTAGLVEAVRRTGARAVWRCHVGRDTPNALTDAAWDFLRPYLQDADAFVFSRRVYAPGWVDDARLSVIPPSIDPYSPKNTPLADDFVRETLVRAGLVTGPDTGTTLNFGRRDGGSGTIRPHRTTGGLVLDGPPPPAEAPLVVQVSRWDRLKDMAGVLDGFARMLQGGPVDASHLMLVGPEATGVTDDPEQAQVLAECRNRWSDLPEAVRGRIHLAPIPMDDLDENAVIVNALQRHAAVVVQKSLVEGFGLTVTEALWKARPVLASRIGGIQDQIRDGQDGLLIDDPTDLDAFAARLRAVLADHELALRLGKAAQERVTEEYLGDRHLTQYVELFSRLVARSGRPAAS